MRLRGQQPTLGYTGVSKMVAKGVSKMVAKGVVGRWQSSWETMRRQEAAYWCQTSNFSAPELKKG